MPGESTLGREQLRFGHESLDRGWAANDRARALNGGSTFVVAVSRRLPSATELFDPAERQRREQAFLRDTAVFRAALADADRERQRIGAWQQLALTLTTLWHDTSRSELDRRRAIFELWYEHGEPGASPRDEPTLAQARIEQYIRVFLPLRSGCGYSNAELQALRRLHPAGPMFDPYGASPAQGEGQAVGP